MSSDRPVLGPNESGISEVIRLTSSIFGRSVDRKPRRLPSPKTFARNCSARCSACRRPSGSGWKGKVASVSVALTGRLIGRGRCCGAGSG